MIKIDGQKRSGHTNEKYGKVAIVIANYNGQEVLMECIRSILKSEYSDFIIIVVDDCSDDFDKQAVMIDSRIVCLQNKENAGFAKTTNRGIAYAVKRGFNYVLLLNNDTEIHCHMISKLVQESQYQYVTVPKMYYAERPNIIWYAGGRLDQKSGYAHHIGNKQRDLDKVCHKAITFATGCCMLIPVDVIKKIGMLHASYYMYFEDVEFSARLLLNHIKLLYVSDAVLWHKVGYSTGGAGSPKQRYYLVRNHLFFIKTSPYINNKKTAYFIMLRDTFNDLINPDKEKRYKEAILLAWRDFLIGRMGKVVSFD